MKKMKYSFRFPTLALGLSLTIGMLLFISCSEELADEASAVEAENQLTAISLAHDGSDLIEIKDLTDTSPQVAVSKATEAAGLDRGRFNITLKFVFPPNERQEQVFNDAASRWERIIIGDVPSFTGVIPSALRGFPPVVDGTLDDIVIEVVLASIDGPGGVLGQAGPRFIRLDDFLTLSGVMIFDVADLSFLEQLGLFEDVIVHEMGHVLGIGTLWNINFPPLGFNRNLLQGPLSSPYFAGQQANVFWNAEGGLGELPIENLGGPGTAFGHWKESTLNNELMTGFLNLGENPLSRITAGSMRDLGYRSANVGEQYDLPKGTPGVDLDDLEAAAVGQGLNIARMETLLQPIGYVTSSKKK